MWAYFFTTLGLVFVFEGILPFLSPRLWRQWISQMMMQPDRVLRVVGFISMLVGLLLITLVHELF